MEKIRFIDIQNRDLDGVLVDLEYRMKGRNPIMIDLCIHTILEGVVGKKINEVDQQTKDMFNQQMIEFVNSKYNV